MKIAYIVYDFNRSGGIERYVRELARRMADAGHEVHVVSTGVAADKYIKIKFHQIHVPGVLPELLRLIVFRNGAEEIISEQEFDIIHSQGNDCLVHNVITAHSCHKAWVAKAKTFGCWEYLKKVLYPKHWMFTRNEEANYRKYNQIIAVSGEVKREIAGFHNVPEQKIEVIYPGVDLAQFNPERKNGSKPFRNRLGLKEEDFVVLFIANEFRRKGLSNIIRAMALLKESKVKLLVVGRGRSWLYRLQALRLGLEDQVIFVKPEQNVAGYYAAGDLFLLPTKHEAFGMVISEAMASGIPVIVSRLAGAAELIHDEKCLIDDPFDVREIASKLRYFADNKTTAAQTGDAMRAAVEPYSWDAMAKRTLEVYMRAAAKNV